MKKSDNSQELNAKSQPQKKQNIDDEKKLHSLKEQAPATQPANNGRVSAIKFKTWGPFAALFGGLGIYIFGQILTLIIISILASSSQIGYEAYYEENIILINFIGSATLGSLTVLLSYMFARKYGGFRALGFRDFKLKALGYTVLAFGLYFLLSASFFYLAENFLDNVNLDQEQDVGFDNLYSPMQYIMAFVALVIIAPISEEVLFRGIAYQGLRSKLSWLPAAIISSGLFALAHFQFNVGIDTFALGILACWLLEKTGTIWASILLHAAKNYIAFMAIFVLS